MGPKGEITDEDQINKCLERRVPSGVQVIEKGTGDDLRTSGVQMAIRRVVEAQFGSSIFES